MVRTESDGTADMRSYRTCWRLVFRFDGSRITLDHRERQQRIAVGTPPYRPVAGRNSGTWLELVGRSGEVLFHRLLHDPLRTRAEHHSPDRRIELHVRDPLPCTFEAVIPVIPGAAEVILYASPFGREQMFEAAAEIGRYPLHDGEPEPSGASAA